MVLDKGGVIEAEEGMDGAVLRIRLRRGRGKERVGK